MYLVYDFCINNNKRRTDNNGTCSSLIANWLVSILTTISFTSQHFSGDH